MLSITLQVSLYIAVHAWQHCVGDTLQYMHGNIVWVTHFSPTIKIKATCLRMMKTTYQSHNQNTGHMFEDDENKATIVAESK